MIVKDRRVFYDILIVHHWLTILYPRLRFITRATCITPKRASTLAAAMTAISPFVTRGLHPEKKKDPICSLAVGLSSVETTLFYHSLDPSLSSLMNIPAAA